MKESEELRAKSTDNFAAGKLGIGPLRKKEGSHRYRFYSACDFSNTSILALCQKNGPETKWTEALVSHA